MRMRKQNKIRCKACLLPYPRERSACPHCGYRADDGYTQPCPEALPLCFLLENLRIGRVIAAEKDGFSYIGLEMRTNKRVRIQEFFPHGYVRRDSVGQMEMAEEAYAERIQQRQAVFCAQGRHFVYGNGTVYRYGRLFRKRMQPSVVQSENIALRTDIGARRYQEDAADFRLSNDGVFAVLCDGMGGLRGGDVASGECLRLFLEIADAACLCDEEILTELLRRRAVEADRYIASLRDQTGSRLRAGTTLVCAVIREECLYFVSVGDSHLYRIRDNAIELLTEEHNYFAELCKEVQAGERTLAEAQNDPKRDALTSYIGIGNITKLHVPDSPVFLREGELLLVCSDGLYRTLDAEEILSITTDNAPVAALADALMRRVRAYRLPKQDNTTFLLYRYVPSKGKKQ